MQSITTCCRLDPPLSSNDFLGNELNLLKLHPVPTIVHQQTPQYILDTNPSLPSEAQRGAGPEDYLPVPCNLHINHVSPPAEQGHSWHPAWPTYYLSGLQTA